MLTKKTTRTDMMSDPWEDVRVTKALETIEKAIGYDGSSIVTIGSLQYLALKDGARIIEDDLDALLAVVPFVAEVKEWAETHDELMVGDERDWETEAIDRDRVISEWMSKAQDILDALPEHLK